MQPAQPQHLKLLVTIVDRGKGQLAVDLLLEQKVVYHRIMLGRGTAKTEILDLLGIGDPAKDIILSILPESRMASALHRLKKTLQFDNPGHGIAFTLAICSVGGQRVLSFLSAHADEETGGKEHHMERHTEKQYDLILAVVNKGFADQVMDAARPAGAQGGTVMHARGAGMQEAEKFFGITIQPEKEIVLILAHHEHKRPIMEAICHAVGLNTEGRGIVFSLPVEEAVGVARIMREE